MSFKWKLVDIGFSTLSVLSPKLSTRLRYRYLFKKPLDLKNPKSNHKSAGFSDEEREKMTTLLSSGFTDTFRHLYPDLTGAYSWWSYRFQARQKNAGWRIDYFLISDRLKEKIVRAEILSDVYGSDHCPVLLELDL